MYVSLLLYHYSKQIYPILCHIENFIYLNCSSPLDFVKNPLYELTMVVIQLSIGSEYGV